MPSSTTPLTSKPRASIVGAGLAGLSAATALRRAGWTCNLYERSSFSNEIGAAISVNPPATRVLTSWGFDFVKAQPTSNKLMITRNGADLSVLGEERYGNLVEKWGFEALFFHRVDLHRGLLDLATGENGDGEPANVVLSRKVIDVDCERGVLRFDDGEEVASDLVVVADGAHSHLVSAIKGIKEEATPTGRSIFRFLLPMEKVLSVPELAKLYKDGETGFRINLDFKDEVLYINYPCRENTVLNSAVVHNTRKDQDESDVWNSAASVKQLLEVGQNFHPTIKKYFELCEDEDVRVHHAMKRPALSSFINGCALVIGDAAHVMLPTHAAGLTVAVESAAALEPIMTGSRPGDAASIKKRLEIWDKLRLGRSNFVMLMSNAGPAGLNVPGVEEEIKKYYDGPIPPKEAGLWTEKSREVFLNCDAIGLAQKAVRDAQF